MYLCQLYHGLFNRDVSYYDVKVIYIKKYFHRNEPIQHSVNVF